MAMIDVRRFAEAVDARHHYLAEIDTLAEAALACLERTGLAAVHVAKAHDASRRAGPWLDAECLATGLDPESAARRILGARDRCTGVALAIEQARIAAKIAVRSTDDPRAMHSALIMFNRALEANNNGK